MKKELITERASLAIVILTGILGLGFLLYGTGMLDLQGGITGRSIEEINQPPEYIGTSISTTQDASITIDLSSYFTDPEEQELTFLVAEEDVISASIEENTATFTPSPGFVGERTLTIIATDGENIVKTPVKITVTASEPVTELTAQEESEQQQEPPEEESGGGFGGQGFSGQAVLTACAQINDSSTLSQNLISNGTCINIGASNLELDCLGFSIFYNSDGGVAENGIASENRNNITIRDCIIVDINSSGSDGWGINFTNTTNSLLQNNTIFTNGTNTNYGIMIQTNSSNNSIINNNITTRGTVNNNYGIRLANTIFNTNITGNTIITNGGTSNFGIRFDVSDYNIISNNNITANGSSNNRGIDVLGSTSGNNITDNTITTRGTAGNNGIRLQLAASNLQILNNLITNNNINVIATLNDNEGILLDGVALSDIFGNNITGNTIITSGSIRNHGIRMEHARNNSVHHNNITVNVSSDNNHGIYLQNTASANNVTGNKISTNGNFTNDGIRLETNSNNNIISDNNITTAGNDSYGIRVINSNGTAFNNTILNNTVLWISQDSNSFNNFTNTTFSTENGSIRIPAQIQFNNTVNITRGNLNITSNNVFLNSTALPFFNTSAQITLNDITFIDPKPVVDFDDDGTFEDCPASTCTEISFSNNVFVYNVTQFTQYSSQDGISVGPITINESFTLTQNVLSNDTGIIINGDDLVLDGAGFTIRYNANGGNNEFGIAAVNHSNVTVRDIVIVDINAAGSNGYGINFSHTNFSSVLNSSIFTNSSGGVGYGVRFTLSHHNNLTNSTIRTNGSLQNVGVVIVFGANHSVRENVILTNSSSGAANSGIQLTTSQQNKVENNTILTAGLSGSNMGLELSRANLSRIINNTIITTRPRTGAGQNDGIELSFLSNFNTIIDNTIFTNESGVGHQAITITDSNSNNITSNIIVGDGTSANPGIRLLRSSFTRVARNSIFALSSSPQPTRLNAIEITDSPEGGTFEGNNLTSSDGIENYGVAISNSNHSTFNNTILFNPAGWINTTATSTDNNFTNTTFVMPNGSIRIIGTITINASQRINKSILNVSDNVVFVNSTAVPALNTSNAQITLNGVTLTDPKPTVDFDDDGTFEDCPASICEEISFSGGTFIYNVTQFTQYSSQETVINVSQGGVTINESLTMVEDINANDTGIIIGGNNMFLNCAGFSIFYGRQGNNNSYGVVSAGNTNITIHDCLIVDINSSGINGIGVNLTSTNDSTAYNNTIFTNGSSNNLGVALSRLANRNLVENNTIQTQGTADTNAGINLFSSSSNNITGNAITTNGTNSNRGVRVLSNSNNNAVANNTIITRGSSNNNHGIEIVSSSGNNASENTIFTNGTSSNNGIIISLTGNNIVGANRLFTDGTASSNTGISLQVASQNNNITGNTIVTLSGDSDGIDINDRSNNNKFENNNVSTIDSTGFGVSITSSNFSTFNNTILFDPSQWIETNPETLNNFTNTTFEQPNGSIRYIGAFQITGSHTVNKAKLNISDNNAFLNSANLSFLNISAQITLLGITSTNPQPTVDFEDDGTFVACPESTCTEISFSGNAFVYNVTQFTQYSSQETPQFNTSNISVAKTDSPDPVNASANLTYQINVTSSGNGTAFNVTLNDTYPDQVIFISASPTPLSGTNNTFVLGNLTNGTSVIVNVTLQTLDLLINNTVINNTANATFNNETGNLLRADDTEATTISNPSLINVTITNSTLTDCEINDSIVTDSIKTNCTITGGTVIGSNNTDSTVINSTEDASNNTNSTVVRSTINASTKTNSLINDSTITNSNLTGCTVINSTVINSDKTDCTIINSFVIDSTNTNATIIDSNETNSTDTNTLVDDSIIIDSTKIGSDINNSNVTNSNITNSTITNSTVIDSDITNGTIINNTITNTTLISSNLTSCTVDNSTVEGLSNSSCFISNTTINISQAPSAPAAGQGGGGGGSSGGIIRRPEIESPAEPECVESWACEGWSSCDAGTQARVCIDLNNCGTEALKPIMRQSCVVPAVAPKPEPVTETIAEPEPQPEPVVEPETKFEIPEEYADIVQAAVMAAALLALAVFFIVSARSKYQSPAAKPESEEDKQELITLSKQSKESKRIEKIDVSKLAKELAQTHKMIEKLKKK